MKDSNAEQRKAWRVALAALVAPLGLAPFGVWSAFADTMAPPGHFGATLAQHIGTVLLGAYPLTLVVGGLVAAILAARRIEPVGCHIVPMFGGLVALGFLLITLADGSFQPLSAVVVAVVCLPIPLIFCWGARLSWR